MFNKIQNTKTNRSGFRDISECVHWSDSRSSPAGSWRKPQWSPVAKCTLNSMLTKEGSMELRQNIMLNCGIPWKYWYVSTIPKKCQIISSKSHFLYPTWASMEIREIRWKNADPFERRICSPLWLVPRAASKRAKPAAQKRSVTVRGASLSASSIEKYPYTSDRHVTYMYFTYIYIYIYKYMYAYHIICIYELWTYILKYMSQWIMSWEFRPRLQPDQIAPSDSLSVPWIWSPPWWRSYRSFRRKAVAVSGFANQHDTEMMFMWHGEPFNKQCLVVHLDSPNLICSFQPVSTYSPFTPFRCASCMLDGTAKSLAGSASRDRKSVV